MIDLHCHTSNSDSSMSVRETIELAHKKGINHLAITDHDTISGIKEALSLQKTYNITIVPGIELSSFDYKRNKKVHILGYYIDYNNKLMKNTCKSLLRKRNEASKAIVDTVISLGYNISWEQVKNIAKNSSAVYKRHIMSALVQKGYSTHTNSNLYKELFYKNEKILNASISSMKYISLENAISSIKLAGGIPVLAHPGVFDNFDAIKDLIYMGIEGIEVNHPAHTKEQIGKCKFYANKYNLIQTAGSDFHGIYGEKSHFGNMNAGINCIHMLQSKIKNKELDSLKSSYSIII